MRSEGRRIPDVTPAEALAEFGRRLFELLTPKGNYRAAVMMPANNARELALTILNVLGTATDAVVSGDSALKCRAFGSPEVRLFTIDSQAELHTRQNALACRSARLMNLRRGPF